MATLGSLANPVRYSHQPLVPLLYIQDIFRCVGKEDSRSASHGKRIIWVLNGKERCGKKRNGPVFLVVVKRILILTTHATAEREKTEVKFTHIYMKGEKL